MSKKLGRPKIKNSNISIAAAVKAAGSKAALCRALDANHNLVHRWKESGRRYVPRNWALELVQIFPELQK